MSSILSELAGSYGYGLREFGEDANDYIAEDFQERANEFLEDYLEYPFPQYQGKLDMQFRFVEPLAGSQAQQSGGLDAWIAPVYSSKGHGFVIFVSINLLRGISDVFTAMALGPEKIAKGILEEDVEEKFETDIYPMIVASLIFIFLHELSHAVRAHLPFYFGGRYRRPSPSVAVGMDLHLVKAMSGLDAPDKLRIHRCIEIDADLLAIGLIHEFLTNNAPDNPFFYEEPSMNDPRVFGESISVVTRLLEQWRRVDSGERYQSDASPHPHPDIRYVFLTSWLMARKKLSDTSEKFLSTTLDFEAGFDQATKKMELFGSQFFPLFEYLEFSGKDAVMQEYELLRLDLDTFLRPQLKDFLVDR